MLKRVFDIVLACVLIVLLAPLYGVLSCFIFIKDGMPIIFKHVRPGYKEVLFSMYKFRTMSNEKDLNGLYLSDEKRLSVFGTFLRRWSLDELPQLFNILKGEMSFVGPRPLLVEYLKLYNDIQRKRHDVLPGITGWAQVNGRNAISWEEKFAYDVWYVEHYSFWLDVKILGLSVVKVLKKENISSPTSVTMESFKGSHNAK